MRPLCGLVARTNQLPQNSNFFSSGGRGGCDYRKRSFFRLKAGCLALFFCVSFLLLLHNFRIVSAFRPDPSTNTFRGQAALQRARHFQPADLYPQPIYFESGSLVSVLPAGAFLDEDQGASEENPSTGKRTDESEARRPRISDRFRTTLRRASGAVTRGVSSLRSHISRGALRAIGAVGGWRSLPRDTYAALLKENLLLEQEGRLSRLLGMFGLGKSLRNDVKTLKTLAQKIHHWNLERQAQIESGERPRTKLIIAVRHAESVFNKWRRESFTRLRISQMLKRDQGKQDVELSLHGIKQCKHANGRMAFLLHEIRDLESKYLEDRSPRGEPGGMFSPFCTDVFLVSPMMRTLQTASLVFENLYSKLRCQPVSDVGIIGSKSDGTLALKERHLNHGYWIVDPLLRERISTNGDVGTERHQLSELLPGFYNEQKMGAMFVNFHLIHPGSLWWIPHTQEHLLDMAQDIEQQKAQSKADGGGEESADTDDEETVASESDRTRAEVSDLRDVVAVGLDNEPLPQLSPVVEDVAAALQKGERKGFEPKVEMEKRQVWEEASRRLRFYQTVPPESSALVRLRAKVWLMSLCLAKSADVVAVVTHSMFLKALTNDSKFSNAEIRAYAVNCENYTVKRL